MARATVQYPLRRLPESQSRVTVMMSFGASRKRVRSRKQAAKEEARAMPLEAPPERNCTTPSPASTGSSAQSLNAETVSAKHLRA